MITETNTLDIMIAKAKENLSDETKASINTVSWRLILSGINKKYTPDQIDSLELETELLLYGLISPEEYPKELEGRMRLHKAEVALLINEIDKLVFKKIQEELEKRLEQKKDAPVKKEIILDPRFTNLPIETQRAISISDWKESIFEIAKKYKLNIEQTGELEQTTIKTLNNVIHTDQYEAELKSKFNLPDDTNKEMVAELNLKIFKNIKELMKSSSGKAWKIPVPPYVKKRMTVVPLPPVFDEPKKESTTVVASPENLKKIKEPVDPYKEHGIEIINNDELLITNEKTKKENTVIPELKNQEIVDSIKNYELKIKNNVKTPPVENHLPLAGQEKPKKEKVTPEKPLVNIMMDKLMNKTASNMSVSNYSIPKMSTSAPSQNEANANTPENPHDPYHENI